MTEALTGDECVASGLAARKTRCVAIACAKELFSTFSTDDWAFYAGLKSMYTYSYL